MKKIIGLLLMICLIIPISSWADTSTDVEKLVTFVHDPIASKKIPAENFGINLTVTEDQNVEEFGLRSTEQLAKLKNWRYIEHYLWVTRIHYKYTNTVHYQITVGIKEVCDALSPNSYTYVEWVITDPQANGTIGRVIRDFTIVMKNYMNEGYNIKLLPQWPEEFREGFLKKFWNPSREEGQNRYSKEITYWLNFLKDYMS